MVVALFIISLCVGGVVLSIVPVDRVEPHAEVDYHLVPFSGDTLGV